MFKFAKSPEVKERLKNIKEKFGENGEKFEIAPINIDSVLGITENTTIRTRIANLTLPEIKLISVNKLIVDLTEEAQRDAILRLKKLIKQFGENGEKFDMQRCGVLTVVRRSNGTYQVVDGAGRLFAIKELLKNNSLKVYCLILRDTGAQVEKQAFCDAKTGVVPLANGHLFMTQGYMEDTADNNYSVQRQIVNVLNKMNYTTAPGHGIKTLTLSAVVFAGRLGYLQEAYDIANRLWFQETLGNSAKKVEGTALSALAAFLYTYKNDMTKKAWERLEKRLGKLDFKKLKATAQSKNKRNIDAGLDQSRDESRALAEYMVKIHNSHLPEGMSRLSSSNLHKIQKDFAHEQDWVWSYMNDAWRLKEVGEVYDVVDED